MNSTTSSKLTTFVAVLCALLALVTLCSFSSNDPFWMSEELKAVNSSFADLNEKMEVAATEQEEKQEAYDSIYIKNKERIDTAEANLQTANDNLDRVCSEEEYDASRRGFYYYYYGPCYNNGCEALHKAVDTAEETMEKLDEELGISELKNRIAELEEEIAELEPRLAEVKEQRKELSSAMTKAVFMLIAILLSIVGLIGLAVGLKKEPFGKVAAFSVYGLMVSTLILIFCGYVSLLLSMVGLIMFAVIISAKNSKAVRLRVTAIVCFVLLFLFSIVTLSSVKFAVVALVLYVITMIVASFALVPLEFKYTSIAKHIFLSIITLGIWLLVWIYHITKNLNEVSEMEDRNPTKELLLCVFLPVYVVYWLYKTAENVESFGECNDKKYNISILCLAFAVISPMISTILIQDKINQTLGKTEENEEEFSVEAEPVEEAVSVVAE